MKYTGENSLYFTGMEDSVKNIHKEQSFYWNDLDFAR